MFPTTLSQVKTLTQNTYMAYTWSTFPIIILVTSFAISLKAEVKSEFSSCKVTRKLEVLPGRGWDSLQNKVLNQVLMLNYTKCKTTDDGIHLIPDQVFTIPIKKRDFMKSMQYIDDWRHFKSLTSRSFSINADFLLLEGSFSKEHLDIKEKEIEQHSITVRVKLHETKYTVGIDREAHITSNFRTLLLNALSALQANDTRMAECILEYVVRDYGTHIVTSVEAGGILLMEDSLSTEEVRRSSLEKTEIATSAALKFASIFNSKTSDVITEVQRFNTLTKQSSFKSIGGAPFKDKMSFNEWLNTVADNMVGIDYSGDPLHFFITPSIFPFTVQPKLLETLRFKLDETIKRYYSINTHKGCTDKNDPNFDYAANMDDGSCGKPSHKHLFGGVYQICYATLRETENLCSLRNLESLNPLTNAKNCPDKFQAIKLVSGTLNEYPTSESCWDEWHGWWIFKKSHRKCKTITHHNSAHYSGYWCSPTDDSDTSKGLMFGGLFTSRLNNPVTNVKWCPPYYNSLRIGQDIRICVSKHYVSGHKYSLSLGGFFSCLSGNPIAARELSLSAFPYECPPGYTQNSAAIDNNCEINYCLKSNAKAMSPPLIRPPFTNSCSLMAPKLYNGKEQGSLEALEGQEVQRSGNAIAVIVCVTLAIIMSGIAVGLYFYRRRKRLRTGSVLNNQIYVPLPQISLKELKSKVNLRK